MRFRHTHTGTTGHNPQLMRWGEGTQHLYPSGLLRPDNLLPPGSTSDWKRFQGASSLDVETLDRVFYNDHGARYVDLQLGRWNAVDPLAEAEMTVSPYSFLGADPVNYTDGSGLKREFIEFGVDRVGPVDFMGNERLLNLHWGSIFSGTGGGGGGASLSQHDLDIIRFQLENGIVVPGWVERYQLTATTVEWYVRVDDGPWVENGTSVRYGLEPIGNNQLPTGPRNCGCPNPPCGFLDGLKNWVNALFSFGPPPPGMSHEEAEGYFHDKKVLRVGTQKFFQGTKYTVGFLVNTASIISIPLSTNLAAIKGLLLALRDPNKIRHLFSNAAHKLGPLVEKLGSQEAVVGAIFSRLGTQALPKSGNFATRVTIEGFEIEVRGTVHEGIIRIGTFFIP